MENRAEGGAAGLKAASTAGQSEVKHEEGISGQRVGEMLERIGTLRAGVIGDVCLDIYWEADMTRSGLSRETPHYTLPIVRERYSPGAAGNVAANLAALGCREVAVCSVVGSDWRGGVLREEFGRLGIDTSYLITGESWTTPAYCKPIRIGLQGSRQEDARLDFQNVQPLQEQTVLELERRLDEMAAGCDIIAVTDQLAYGVVGDTIRRRLAFWAGQGKIVLVDSRDRIGLFRGVIVKPNEVEAGAWLACLDEAGNRGARSGASTNDAGHAAYRDNASSGAAGLAEMRSGALESVADAAPLARWTAAAGRLSAEAGAACCLTLGEAGAIWHEAGEAVFIPTRPAEPPVDIVGAGDAFAAAMLCALGAGASGAEAAAFAHLASAVVIRKLGTTGTASPEEIIGRHATERSGKGDNNDGS